MPNKLKISNFHIFILFIILSYVYGVSQFRNNTLFATSDIYFHLNRIYSLSDVFSSPNNFQTFGSLGQIINIFYGWLTLFPAYLGYLIFGNLVTAYNIFLFALTLFTLSISYYCVYSLSREKFVSIVFSILYSFSTYRTSCIFFRGAIGEVIALAFYPIIFLAMYNIVIKNKNSWISLSISVSLLFYTHVLSAFIALFFMLLIYIVAMINKSTNKKVITIILIKAGMSCFILSLAFLLPLLEQSTYQKIVPPGIAILSDRALPISEIGIIATKELTSFSIGPLLLLLTVSSLFLLFWFKRQYKFIFCLGLLALIMSTKLFPWSFFQDTPIQMIQFPWRLVGMATLFLSFSSSYLLSNLIKTNLMRVILVYLLIFIMISMNLFSVSTSRIKNSIITKSDSQNIIKTYNTENYRPAGYEKFLYLTDSQSVSVDQQIFNISERITGKFIGFSLETNKNQEIILPVYRYKGTKVYINEKEVPLLNVNEPMVSILSIKGENNIKVVNSYTLLAKLSSCLSILFFLWILFIYFKK